MAARGLADAGDGWRCSPDLPADRRRFLDRLVLAIDPGHGQRALDYEKAMRGRNRLLAEGSRDGAWFDAIETQMAETGVAIAAARAELVRLLAAMIDRLPGDGAVSAGRSSAFPASWRARSASAPAVEVEERFRARACRRPRARPRRRPHARRPAPLRSLGASPAEGDAGRTLLDRRAEGAAGRHRAVACAADRRDVRHDADPAARRDRRASRRRPARGAVFDPGGA